MGCEGHSLVHLCAVHRRICQCSSCKAACECFYSSPTSAWVGRGVDFLPCYRPLSTGVYGALGRQCRSQPKERDQLHPRLEALTCSSCDTNARIVSKKKAEAAQRLEARAAAERERRAATLAAQGPDAATISVQSAVVHTLRSAARSDSSISAQVQATRTSSRLHNLVRLVLRLRDSGHRRCSLWLCLGAARCVCASCMVARRVCMCMCVGVYIRSYAPARVCASSDTAPCSSCTVRQPRSGGAAKGRRLHRPRVEAVPQQKG